MKKQQILRNIMKDMDNIGYVYLNNSAGKGDVNMFLENLSARILGNKDNYSSIDTNQLQSIKNRLSKLNHKIVNKIIKRIDDITTKRKEQFTYGKTEGMDISYIILIIGLILLFIMLCTCRKGMSKKSITNDD